MVLESAIIYPGHSNQHQHAIQTSALINAAISTMVRCSHPLAGDRQPTPPS
ncbi:MAG: hypothetical protein ACLPVY_19460 [Acidimicrobiia bacterium]